MTVQDYERRWDSLQRGYFPPDDLAVPANLPLHSDTTDDIDPITYEVLRSRLWSINIDHQDKIRRISGSSICVYAWDFNTAIHMEDGAGAVFAPGVLIHAGCADLVVKWTIEHRGPTVGINDGDVFLACDPWVGANHAMDASAYTPVFVDGKLFCWVYNVIHQQEVGGVEPGGFVQQARDVYWEPLGIPPIKMIDRGVVRDDVVDMWIRRSRQPQMCHLELKSQFAGLEFAKSRLLETIEEYGPEVVKGVMHRMVDNAEKAVRSRIATIPDGQWVDERYVAGSLPDDRRVHKLRLRITKHGTDLSFSNEGTDPAYGMFNVAPGAWRAALLMSALPMLGYDQYLCGAGVLRCLDFTPEIGTITSCAHPSACQASIGTVSAMTQAHHLLAKVMGASEDLWPDRVAVSALHTHVVPSMYGLDQQGAPFAALPFDCNDGGSGACAFHDGLDHGGGLVTMRQRLGNVEEWEQSIPFLYLYRRQLPWIGGHGQWRGGANISSAWTGHKSQEVYISSGGLLTAVTQGLGLDGAPPSSGGMYWYAQDTPVVDALSRGEAPARPEELRSFAPDGGIAPSKRFDNRLSPGDIFEVTPCAGAGLGDPVLREIDLVAQDVERGRLSAQHARDLYGAALDEQGRVDVAASQDTRAKLLLKRISAAPGEGREVQRASSNAAILGRAVSTVLVVEHEGARADVCTHCRCVLGDGHGDYRAGCVELRVPLGDIDPRIFVPPLVHVDQDLFARSFICPGCGYALDGDICTGDDVPYRDVWLDDPDQTGDEPA
jgi:N-methylhydantoinase B